MAKPPPKLEALPPEDFAQTTPDLYSMADIRVVMREQGALGARMDALKESVEKLGDTFEKALDRHAKDMKECVGEIRADLKETDSKVVEIEKKVVFVKGAMWVLGTLFVIAAAVGGIAASVLG